MTARTTRRRGFTLFEVIVVIAVLILLAAIIIPSMMGFRGDTRQRAAADVIRSELATARARAKEEGRPYRVAVNQDGTRIRRAPDDSDFAQTAATDSPGGSTAAVEYSFDSVTVSVVPEAEGNPPSTPDGWTTIACVQPDGTCREDSVLIAIKENDQSALYLRVRGLTGNSRVVSNPTGGKQ